MGDKVDKQQKSNGKKPGGVTGKGFMPGKSGNPKGRPKKELCFPEILRRILDEPSPRNEKITNYELIAMVAIDQASKGDKDARNWVADRAEGKAIDRIIQKFDDDELIIL